MLKIFMIVFCALFVTQSTLSALDTQPYFHVGVGDRRDTLTWKTKLDEDRGRSFSKRHKSRCVLGCKPSRPCKGKLKIHMYDIPYVFAEGRICMASGYLAGKASYGWTYSGRSKNEIDTLVLEETFHEKVRGSSFVDLEAWAGYPWYYLCYSLEVSPLLGFAYHKQRIRTENKGLCSQSINTYRLSWWSCYLGCELMYHWNRFVKTYVDFKYHYGEANGRRDTGTGVGFFDEHRMKQRKTEAISGRLGTRLFFSCNWYIDINGEFQDWYRGSDEDDVQWNSYRLQLGVGGYY